MRSWTIAFSLGVCLALLLPVLPEFPASLLLPACVLACMLIRRWPLVCAYCLGLVWTIVTLQLHYHRLLPENLEQKDIWIRGVVSSLPRVAERSVRINFLVSALCPQEDIDACETEQWRFLQGRGLNRSRQWQVQLNDYQGLNLKPGEEWQLQVRLKRPRGFSNPATFDYEAWLWEEGFMATGYIRDNPANLRLASPRLSEISSRLRFRIREKLQQKSGIMPEAGETAEQVSSRFRSLPLLQALSVGDRYGISASQWALFSLSGTNHLMVISGLHIGLVAMLCYQLLNIIARLLPALMMRLPAQRLAAIAAILGALGYSALAGFSLPTQRAFIMVAAFMLGRLLLRQTRGLNNLCLALAVTLLLNPLAPVSAGFWLSFGAVAILLQFAVGRPGPDEPGMDGSLRQGNIKGIIKRSTRRILAGSLRAQWALFIGLFPLLLIHFQQFSIIAPVINLLAIPLVGLIVVPLILAGVALVFVVPGIALLLLLGADFLLYHFMQTLALLQSAWPGLLMQLPAIAWWGKVLIVPGACVLLSPLALRYKSLALLAACLPFVLPHDRGPSEGSLSLHILDVGQGLSVVVETATQTLIYDLGPVYSERFNAGGGLILPFLRGNNLPAPDTIIVSHAHADHSGGLLDIVQAFPEATILAGEPEALEGRMEARPCLAGQHWRYDGVDFEFLHPIIAGTGNEQSCVLRISTGTAAVLLPGDIERGTELRLQHEAAEKLRANVLLAPHHGSKTSSTSAFVAAVNPDYVVFSTGYLNRFRHPAPEIMERYREQGAILLNTAQTGAVSFEITEAGVAPPRLFRRDRRRVWRSSDQYPL